MMKFQTQTTGSLLRAMALASLLGGCSTEQSVSPDAESGADAGQSNPDAAIADAAPDVPLRTVTVLMNRRFVTPSGEVTVPIPVAEMQQDGLVLLVGSELGVELQPIYEGDGVASFGDIPAGPVYIRKAGAYFVTENDQIDFGFDVLGRADAAVSEISPTDLVLNVSDMSAWQDGDELQIFSEGSGLYANAMQGNASAGLPLAGDTALAGFTYDINNSTYSDFLVDGDAGDRALVTHLGPSSDGTHSYLTVHDVFEPESFAMTDGSSTTLNGAFVPVPQDKILSLRWDRAAFDSVLRAEIPAAPLAFPAVVAHTLFEANLRGAYNSSADTLFFVPGYVDDTSELAVSWSYGDPFPSDWTRLLTAEYLTYHFLSLPSGASKAVFSFARAVVDQSTVSSAIAIAPIVGPVTDFQVNGVSAYLDVANVGETPTFSWSPPSVGQSDIYTLALFRVDEQLGEVSLVHLTSLTTAETSVVMPPGLLEADQQYHVRVTTRHETGVDLIATPFHTGLPSGAATASAGLVSF